jgi:hypothetical protein
VHAVNVGTHVGEGQASHGQVFPPPLDTQTQCWNQIGGKGFSMPLDPKDCRRQALQCVRLAQTSASPQVRLHYANLAKTWLTLAGDLEDLDAQTRREEDRIGGPAQLASVYRLLPVS